MEKNSKNDATSKLADEIKAEQESKKLEAKLSEQVAAKYKLEGLAPGVHILGIRHGREKVDFRTMTLQQADALYAKYGKDKDGKATDFYLQPK